MSQYCTCPEGPHCEYSNGACGRPADWSFFTPPGRWTKTWPHGRFTFMCTPCRDHYVAAIKKPLKGIDRPEGVAPEDWKPSIMEHLRLCAIDAKTNEMAERNRLRTSHAPPNGENLSQPGDWRYTPAQLKQLYVLRRHLREERRSSL